MTPYPSCFRGFLPRRLRLGSVLTALLVLPALASAQEFGGLAGSVLESTTGTYVEGAEVTIVNTGLRTLTTRGGRYLFTRVPPGDHLVTFSYPGSPSQSLSVTIRPGEVAELDARLTSDIIELEEISIRGAREGMSQAIALQKASFQVKVVAASDQFGEISEGNVGEYLKFLPGVSIDYNVNDARGVSLRGLSTAFTIVAVDGTPMAGASSVDDTRRFEFEQIAMNNVETTELFKTVTPDIPASATSGFVNFVTKSAFDHPDIERFSYNLSFSSPSTEIDWGHKPGVWGNDTEWVIRPSLEMNYSRKLSKRLGVNVNYRISEKYDSSPRQEITWVTTPAATAGIFTEPRMQQYNIRDEQKLTHRQSFAAKFDYLLSDRTQLTVGGQWNYYDLLFTQRGLQFVLGPNSTTDGNGNYTSGPTGASVNNGVLQRNKFGTTLHFNANLAHQFSNGSQLNITPYWSRADGHYEDASRGFISSAATMAFTGNNSFTLSNALTQGVNPSISVVRDGNPVPIDYLLDLGNYTFNGSGTSIQSRPWIAIDERNGINGNYTFDVESFPVPVTFKTGFAIDRAERYIARPDIRGASPAIAVTGDALRALAQDGYTRSIYGFPAPQVIDPVKILEAYGDRVTAAQATALRFFDEDNYAAYIRADVKLTPEFTLVGGFRWEKREVSASSRADHVGINLTYDDIYPSLSFSYTPRQNLVFRGGISRTVGHPDYGDLLPTITGESSGGADGNMVVPDPNIKPYSSTNFDLSVDYYLPNSGVITAAIFYKDVKNYISSRAMTAAELAATAAAYGYDPAEFLTGTIRYNGGASTLAGIELSYIQNLTFLPKPFNGLSVQTNFSYVDIDSDDIDTFYSQRRAVSPKTFNLVVGYRLGRFNATLTNNWVSESLYGGFVNTAYFQGTAGTASAPDTRITLNKDGKLTTDLKLEYAFSKKFATYFLIRNLFNSKRNEFVRGYLPENYGTVLPFRSFEFGEPHLTLGFRGTF